MKTIVVIGGSKGIGNAIVKTLINTHKIINISRSAPELVRKNLKHYTINY